MNTTLDECNEVLDWLDDNFDFGKTLRARVKKTGHYHFVFLIWFGDGNALQTGFYTPKGWAIGDWWIDENRNWNNGLYRLKT